MKRLISVLTVALLFAACSKNDDMISSTGNNSSATTVAGNFTVSKFTDSNPVEDKTANFNGYIFTFSANGTVTAVKNNVSTQGSYSMKPSHEGEAAKLTLSFSNIPLSDLNKAWQVNTISDNAIHLSDDDNSTEVLEFTAD